MKIGVPVQLMINLKSLFLPSMTIKMKLQMKIITKQIMRKMKMKVRIKKSFYSH